jgi:phospholipid/cholesterol/gamma-HCH transport system substrate-binding protein
MKTAIRKHLGDFAAIIGLILVAVLVSSVILSNQRLSLPGWVPVIGSDFFEIEAEMQTAQSVTPGQGQTVNVAGVEVGEIKSVKLEDGRAIIGMKIEPRFNRVYRDATVLLRPKTGLKDMVAELTPGTEAAGRLPEGGRIPVSQTLPDVNLDEILAALDADTRDYLTLLLNDGGRALKGNGRELANTIRRIEPTAKLSRRVNEALAERSANIKRAIHNFSLLTEELGDRDDTVADFVVDSNAVFATFARQDANLRETLRELPSSLQITQSTLAKTTRLADELGPTLEALRPTARALGPTQRQLRPFLRTTTPIIRDELRPFARASLPTVKQLRPAMRDLAAAAPDLTNTFTRLNRLLNMLAYNPPGETEEGYLFWFSWANHLAPTIFATQDAHGPIRHGLVVFGCQTASLLDSVAEANPQLGTLVDLLNGPNRTGLCPTSSQDPGVGGG